MDIAEVLDAMRSAGEDGAAWADATQAHLDSLTESSAAAEETANGRIESLAAANEEYSATIARLQEKVDSLADKNYQLIISGGASVDSTPPDNTETVGAPGSDPDDTYEEEVKEIEELDMSDVRKEDSK